ncbi:hypothetical protein GCWU000342_00190 [Shuttleworthella satelles DSM 14600]|uniref:Uncharacterized protein n=1 Tax=Shuttleworthella satelles DSM 14600 TaxID=626523 RepID=C4G820_9FIRM|nr:hypothetical protein GCWU000342_00190 [Shuttleworthia satelles DSM 14600]
MLQEPHYICLLILLTHLTLKFLCFSLFYYMCLPGQGKPSFCFF